MATQENLVSEPGIVYHYTSMDTFLKIIQLKQLWATSAAYLNDTTEQEHFFQRALIRLPEVLSTQSDWREWDFSGVADPQEINIVTIATGPFLTSFSTEGDSLPQWRAYCPSGNGISIGFRVENLIQATLHLGEEKDPFGIDHKIKWGRIEYDCSDHAVDSELKRVLNDVTERLQDDRPELREIGSPGNILRSYIRARAIFYKHSSFRTEREYRLVLPGTYWLRQVVHFVATKSTLRPHVKLDVPSLGTAQADKPLHSTWNAVAEVRIGPTPNPSLTAAAVKTMLYDRRINCDVMTSEVPFRDW